MNGRRTYEPSVLSIPSDTPPGHPRFLETLNERLTQLGSTLDAQRGLSGTIFFGADVDMGGHRILNASGTGLGPDLLTQSEGDNRYLRNIPALVRAELAKFTFPPSDPGTGTGTGTPGLPFQSVQFNDDGVFAGDPGLLWDKTWNRLTVGQVTPPTGTAPAGATLTVNGNAWVWTNKPNDDVLVVKGMEGQAGFLQRWDNSDGYSLVFIDHGGAFYLRTFQQFYEIEAALAPALSAAGEARMYMNAETKQLMASVDGDPYIDILAGGGTGTPGLPDQSVQFNDDGVFGGDANLTWNKFTRSLAIFGATPVAIAPALDVNGSAWIVGNLPNKTTLIVKGASGQTFNMQDWNNAEGNTLMSVTGSGELHLRIFEEFYQWSFPATPPALSALNRARIYMSYSNQLMASVNGNPYVDLLGWSNLWTKSGIFLSPATSGDAVKFSGTVGPKLVLFPTATPSAQHGISITSSRLAIHTAFNTDKLSFGYGYVDPVTTAGYTELAYLDGSRFNFLNLFLKGNGYVAVDDHLVPAVGAAYDIGLAGTLYWRDGWFQGKVVLATATADGGLRMGPSGVLQWSNDLTIWNNFAVGGGGPAGAGGGEVQFNRAGVFGANPGFFWYDALKQLTIGGGGDPVSLFGASAASHCLFEGGYRTNLAREFAFYAPGGGVTAAFLMTLASSAAVSGSGQGKLRFNANKWQYSEAGSAWANCFGTGGIGTPAGSDTWIQFNQSGAFGAAFELRFDRVGDITGRHLDVDAVIRVNKGTGSYGNRFASIDLYGDDYWPVQAIPTASFRIVRSNTGPNAATGLGHRGTGPFQFIAVEAAAIQFYTTNVGRMEINAVGDVIIGSSVTVNQAGAITMTGILAATGLGGGINVPNNTLPNAIQAPAGGVAAKFLAATSTIAAVADAGAAISTGGQGKLSYIGGKWKYSEEGSSWANCFGGAASGAAGATGEMQWNNSGAFAASPNCVWDNTFGRIVLTNNFAYYCLIFQRTVAPARLWGWQVDASSNLNLIDNTGGQTAASFAMQSDIVDLYSHRFNRNRIAVNWANTGDRYAIISFHADNTGSFAFQIAREPGPNGNVYITNGGVGFLQIQTQGGPVNFATSGTARMQIAGSDGLLTFGPNPLAPVASISQLGAIQATNTLWNAIHASAGGVAGKSFTALYYIHAGKNNGVPPTTSGDGVSGVLHDGTIYYDTGSNKLRVKLNTGWTDVATGAGGGGAVSSVTGTANQITASPTTGAVVLTLPQNIHTGATVLFGSVTAATTVQGNNSGAGITFQNNSGLGFQVNGNGTISCLDLNVNNASPGTGSLFVGGKLKLPAEIVTWNPGSVNAKAKYPIYDAAGLFVGWMPIYP